MNKIVLNTITDGRDKVIGYHVLVRVFLGELCNNTLVNDHLLSDDNLKFNIFKEDLLFNELKRLIISNDDRITGNKRRFPFNMNKEMLWGESYSDHIERMTEVDLSKPTFVFNTLKQTVLDGITINGRRVIVVHGVIACDSCAELNEVLIQDCETLFSIMFVTDRLQQLEILNITTTDNIADEYGKLLNIVLPFTKKHINQLIYPNVVRR